MIYSSSTQFPKKPNVASKKEE